MQSKRSSAPGIGYFRSAGILRYSNGGHVDPLFLQVKQGKTSELKDTGSALGVKENSEYRDAALPFEEGDLLLCCSDGLVETENAEGWPMRADVVTSLARADRKKIPTRRDRNSECIGEARRRETD